MITRLLVPVLTAVLLAATLHMGDVDAARLGGGRSFGMQRPNISPTMPAVPRQGVTAPTSPSPATVPGRPAGASRWLAPLAGLAAGLGLAALLAHFGLSEAFGSFLLLALLVLAAIFVVRLLMGRRSGQPATQPRYSNALPARVSDPVFRNNAAGSTFEPVVRPSPPASDPYAPNWGGGNATGRARWPDGFDPAPFLEQARFQFNRLQAAWDRGDRAMLRDVTTPEMYREIERDLEARGTQVPTEIVRLEPEILDVSTEGDRHLASVRFTGLMRENGAALAQPFDEIWNLSKPVDSSTGWLLAGIQQAQPQAAS